jgi:hypothetical protein
MGLYSLGIPTNQEKQLPFQHFRFTGIVKATISLHIFQLIWVTAFLVETCNFIVSGAITNWYHHQSQPLKLSYVRFLKYHTGSVAVGSFLTSLFGLLRFGYELLSPENPTEAGCKLKCKQFCDCCCCLCVKFIFDCFNTGAYTLIHLSGERYCRSAGRAVELRKEEPECTVVVLFLSAVRTISKLSSFRH